MLLNYCSLSLLLGLLMQGESAHRIEDNYLTATERAQLQRESDIGRRIKIYDAASVRLHKALGAAVAKGDFQGVPASLESWTLLLASSLKDIEDSVGPRKKPKTLIQYEIHVRKAIFDIQDYQIRATIDQQDIFDSCLARAEAIRKKFVDVLFLR